VLTEINEHTLPWDETQADSFSGDQTSTVCICRCKSNHHTIAS